MVVSSFQSPEVFVLFGISDPADRKNCHGLDLASQREPQSRQSGGALAWARRPRSSHLGKSGWRQGRCVCPSSHWGGCWPSPAGSTAWLRSRGRTQAHRQGGNKSTRSRHPPGKRSALGQPHQKGAVAFAAPPPRSGQGPMRDRWVDTGHPLGGSSFPAPAQIRPTRGRPGGARGRRACEALVPCQKGPHLSPGIKAQLVRGARFACPALTQGCESLCTSRAQKPRLL
jgi:hypothetical protein